MPLVNTKEILEDANRGFYGVGAFNINDMEILQAIVEVAQEEKSPVIIATSEGAIKYAGIEYIFAMVKAAAEKVSVPISLHLDHGKDFNVILSCIRNGYTSVMIDASAYPFDQNVAKTKEIVNIAHRVGVSVEAELGKLSGVEDNVSVTERNAILVNPDEAKRFIELTDVDFLAPAIGTSHGAFKFKGAAKLDFDRLKKVKQLTGIPLVLHGASKVPQYLLDEISIYGGKIKGAKGVPDDVLRDAIKLGINKVNTDTDIRLAMTAGIRKVLAENPEQFDPRKILGPAREEMKQVVRDRIKVLGSSNKA